MAGEEVGHDAAGRCVDRGSMFFCGSNEAVEDNHEAADQDVPDTFLWAFLPLAAIGVIEKIVFNTTHFAMMLGSRISGGMEGPDAKGGR
ncbi:MAG TPA: hypothetical protein VGQ46_05035 [Thermoanaerobaculia bacterium]|jgi:allantoicase|nr:hypothetical protein [Thermoanaerobaculia bacterium]